jgi:hypothetical protein
MYLILLYHRLISTLVGLYFSDVDAIGLVMSGILFCPSSPNIAYDYLWDEIETNYT